MGKIKSGNKRKPAETHSVYPLFAGPAHGGGDVTAVEVNSESICESLSRDGAVLLRINLKYPKIDGGSETFNRFYAAVAKNYHTYLKTKSFKKIASEYEAGISGLDKSQDAERAMMRYRARFGYGSACMSFRVTHSCGRLLSLFFEITEYAGKGMPVKYQRYAQTWDTLTWLPVPLSEVSSARVPRRFRRGGWYVEGGKIKAFSVKTINGAVKRRSELEALAEVSVI